MRLYCYALAESIKGIGELMQILIINYMQDFWDRSRLLHDAACYIVVLEDINECGSPFSLLGIYHTPL